MFGKESVVFVVKSLEKDRNLLENTSKKAMMKANALFLPSTRRILKALFLFRPEMKRYETAFAGTTKAGPESAPRESVRDIRFREKPVLDGLAHLSGDILAGRVYRSIGL